MTYKKNIYFTQTLIHSSLILANCFREEKPSWLQIIGRFGVHWMYIVLRCQNWSGWRVFSQEIPVLLTGRVWDQAFLFIRYFEHFCCCSAPVVSDSSWPTQTAACQAPLSCSISQSLLKLMSVEWVIPSNHLILCCSSVGPFRQWIFLISWIDHWRRILLKQGKGTEIIFLEHSTASDLWKPELQCPCQLLWNLHLFVCLFSPRWL